MTIRLLSGVPTRAKKVVPKMPHGGYSRGMTRAILHVDRENSTAMKPIPNVLRTAAIRRRFIRSRLLSSFIFALLVLASFSTLFASSAGAAVRNPITFISGTATGYVDTLIFPPGMTVSNLPDGGTIIMSSGTCVVVTNGVAGSARRNSTDAIDSLLLPGKSTSFLTFASNDLAVYQRNTNFWGASLDTTCVGIWNSTSDAFQTNNNTRRACVLISSNVVLFAAHYPCVVGSTNRWLTTNNVVVSRTITATNVARIAGTDLGIGLLNSPIPTNLITPALVLGDSWTNQFPSLAVGQPVMGFNQAYQAFVFTVRTLLANGVSVFTAPTTALEQPFGGSVASGDSSKPVLMFVNGKPVILCTWHYVNAGDAVTGHTTALNDAIAALGGASTSNIDLSRFTSF
jgi:hypothetical protein